LTLQRLLLGGSLEQVERMSPWDVLKASLLGVSLLTMWADLCLLLGGMLGVLTSSPP
jgi:hypothetical protein